MIERKVKILLISFIFVGLLASATFVAHPQESYEFTMIVYGDTGNPFWQSVVAGVKEEAKKYDVSVNINYARNDPERQNDMIETAMANKVDGIGVVLNLDEAYDENVKKAINKGIPVIAFNIDDSEGRKGNARMAFVGQDFVEAGYKVTQRLIEEGDIGEGDHVVCPVEHPEAVYARKRYQGVKKALDEVGATSEVLDSGAVSLEDNLTKIVQYLMGHQNTDAILSMGQMPLEVTPQAIEEVGMDIPNAGFDLSETILKNIIDGKTIATVDQQPFYQGAFTVMQLYYQNKYGLVPVSINTGGAIVDQDNAKAALENIEVR